MRRILDFCGLKFQSQCLEFHKTARSIRTASSEQVRRPLSKEGLHQWRHFEPWLGPLRSALSARLRVAVCAVCQYAAMIRWRRATNGSGSYEPWWVAIALPMGREGALDFTASKGSYSIIGESPGDTRCRSTKNESSGPQGDAFSRG